MRHLLLASRRNEVWSWDITKLLGPCKWTYFYLYVILDIFSRYVVGWMVAHGESAALARKLIEQTCLKQNIQPGELTLHADRGSSMISKPGALLLADLGVTRTHSRPHISNDNPFSESQFKTLKYRPEFPSRFGSIEDARSFCVRFFDWYNNEHYHSSLAMLTPAVVHYEGSSKVLEGRARVLEAAYVAHPERFARRPAVPEPPSAPARRPYRISYPSTAELCFQDSGLLHQVVDHLLLIPSDPAGDGDDQEFPTSECSAHEQGF